MFRPAARAADPGEPAAGIATVKVLLDHLFDDRTEIPVFTLETLFIFRDEPLEMMKKHPIEDGAFRMTRTVDSRHIQDRRSRNGPGETRRCAPGRRIAYYVKEPALISKKTAITVDAVSLDDKQD
jgi:hypothetical protein